MTLLAATLVAFLYRRLLDQLIQYIDAPRVPWKLVELVGAILSALLFLWAVGASLYIAVPAYGAALLFHRLDDLMMTRADESLQHIMKNRRK